MFPLRNILRPRFNSALLHCNTEGAYLVAGFRSFLTFEPLGSSQRPNAAAAAIDIVANLLFLIQCVIVDFKKKTVIW